MLVDANTNETGLVEMSYRCFVLLPVNRRRLHVSSKSLDDNPCSTDYDSEMVTADYLMESIIQPRCRYEAILNQLITVRPGGNSSINYCLSGRCGDC